MDFSLSEVFDYNASFLGFILSAIVVMRNQAKRTIKITLFLMLVVASLIVFLGALNFSGKIQYYPHLIRIDSPIHFLLGPCLFFYTLSSLNEHFRFRLWHLLHLLPFTINLIQFLPTYFMSSEEKLNYYVEYAISGSMIIQSLYLLKTISLCSYFLAQLFICYRYQKQHNSKESFNVYLTSWFVVFLLIQLICFAPLLFDHITNLETFSDPYQFAINMISILLIASAIALMFYPRLLYGNTFEKEGKSKKYSYSILSEDDKEQLFSSWKEYVHGAQRPFLNPKLSIKLAAEDLESSQQRLSQVINEKCGINFNDYINSLRIEEAKKMLESDTYKNLTIEAIAEKSGFNSKSPFYTAFKKFTGVTPKQYIQSCELNKQE